jgi:hypothetical protein
LWQELLHTGAADIDYDCRIADIIDANTDALDLHKLLFMCLLYCVYVSHSVLRPYWAARLGKEQLTARQISLRGDRVTIAGHAVLYLEGAITV